MTTAVASEAPTPHCPRCDYDLRGLASDRCPECGQPIDATDTVSRLPWSHRRQRGRVRAYVATAWLVIARPARLYEEFARPVSLRDARRFAAVTAVLLCPVTLAAVAGSGVLVATGSTGWDITWNGPTPSVARAVYLNGGLPLIAGWMATPLIAVFTVLLTFCGVRVLPWVVHRRTIPMPRRARAVALAHYQCATLLVLPALATPLAAVVLAVTPKAVRMRDWSVASAATAGSALLAGGVALLVTAMRAGGFYRRAFGGGPVRALLGPAWVAAGWLVLTVFWLAAVPWAVGAAWLLWQGLRG